jgi:hypothetical protein
MSGGEAHLALERDGVRPRVCRSPGDELRVSAIQAVGSLTFPWSEFNMTAPSVGGFVNVTDRATMEFDLHLQRT